MHSRLAAEVAADYAALGVTAVVLGGSSTSALADPHSDVDLYVYSLAPIRLASRQAIAGARGVNLDFDLRFWEVGDEWDERSGVHVDVMFRSLAFAEEELAARLERHEANIGYTTALLYNFETSEILYDPSGWFAGVQRQVKGPYPQPLQAAIIARNWPLLKGIHGAYPKQLALAALRGDKVAVNHRLTAFLASYFDVLFALNERYHPGEKRLEQHAQALALLPKGFKEDIAALFSENEAAPLTSKVARLVAGLEPLVLSASEQGQIQQTWKR